jgi:hypothetical protein
MDNVTYSNPVPEPEVWALLVAGLAWIGLWPRRRKILAGSSEL